MPEATKSQTEVLEYLAEHHPELHAAAEIDRSWVWLCVDLRGDHNKELRDAIGKQGLGFRFAPKGHPLESGHIGTWSHSCDKPIPFRRKGRGPAKEEGSTMSDEQLEGALAAVLGH